MANLLYPKAKEAFLSGDIDLVNDTIKVIALDGADYTYSSAHDFYDDAASAARVGTATALASKTVTNGVFDAADVTLSSVTGDEFEFILIFQDTGTESTSHLIALFDTATGLAFTPSGGDITITWNASGIFAL